MRLDATTEAHQQAALAKLCEELKRPVPGPTPLPDCPYPGMVPFDEADSHRFFGREQEVTDLIERLRLHPFLAVIGASGSGKSSLVRAGLIPALRRSRLFGGGTWLIRTMRPGEAPLDALAAVLGIAPPAAPAPQPEPLEPDDLLSALLISAIANPLAVSDAGPTTNGQTDLPADIAGDQFLADPAATVAKLLSGEPDARRLLLVVDQFEETFTVARKAAAAFQQVLQQLAAIPGCYVVLTVRADFYADLMAAPLWEQIQAYRAEVTPLGEAGLRRAIVRPAELAGVAVEGALIERLAADAAGEPGVLPLVQETLVLLWERLERRFLPLRAYEALILTRDAYGAPDGAEPTGLQVAIARRADVTLASLTEAQQPIARRIFLRLIQFGEGRADTRRQQPASALRSAGDNRALFDATLQRLAESRLLTLSGAATEVQPLNVQTFKRSNVQTLVDISHEALIRGWPTLQGWLKERREGELTRRRLEGKAQEWVRLGRGSGGLLDEIEVLEAERWLASEDAAEMGFDEALPELIVWSRAELEAAEQAREAARQRELAQAQALAEEQQRRAEEQAAASQRLRARNRWLVAVAGLAAVAAVAAILFLLQSQKDRDDARKSASDAQTAKANAEAAKANAETQKATAEAASLQAAQRERQARAGDLAGQSQLTSPQFPQRRLLLAVEAMSATLGFNQPAVPAAEQALRDALPNVGGRVLDGGSVSNTSSMVASPDGRLLVTLDDDGRARGWDLASADPSARSISMPGITDFSPRALFSPDGRWLVMSSAGRLRVLDMTHGAAGANAVDLVVGDYPINHLVFSQDGRRLVEIDKVSMGRAWDMTRLPATVAPMLLPPATDHLTPAQDFSNQIAVSLDGNRVVIQESRGPIRLWDLSAPDRPQVTALSDSSLLLGPSAERWFITSGSGQPPQLWDITAPTPAPIPLPGEVTNPLISPDGRWLVSTGGAAKLWQLSTSGLSGEGRPLVDARLPFVFSPGGGHLATAGPEGTVLVWNLADPAAPARQLPWSGRLSTPWFSQDGSMLAVTRSDPADNRVAVWDLSTADAEPAPRLLYGHDRPVNSAAFSVDKRHLITYSSDRTARIWDLAPERAIPLGKTFPGAISADARWVTSKDSSGNLRLWDLSTEPITTQLALSNTIPDISESTVSFSADGRRLAIAMADGNVQVWDLPVRAGAHPIDVPAKLEKSPILVLNPDGSRLAVARQDQRLEIWDLAADPPVSRRELPIAAGPIPGMAFSPDGQLLAISFFGKPIQVWDLQNERPDAQPAPLPDTNTYTVKAFSADGRTLITPGKDAAQLWDTAAFRASGDPIVRTIALPGNNASEAATSAELPGVLATSDSGTTLVWTLTDDDPHSWTLTNRDDPHSMILARSTAISLIAFKPGGRTLLAVAHNGAVHEWPLRTTDLIGPACAIAGRSLTWDELRTGFDLSTYQPTCAAQPHPSYIDHLLDEADERAEGGNIDAALAAYADIQRQNPRYVVAAEHWHKLCRAGARWGKVKDVLDACGKAVALAPGNGIYRGSRGLARALTGDTSGAIEDFEAYIATASLIASDKYPSRIDMRKQWIVDLKANKSFDQAKLADLLKRELSEGD